MKAMSVSGAILLIIGVILLVYQGFSFTQKERVVDVGPVHVDAQREKTVPIPPIIGWVVTGAGAVLLVAGVTKSR